MNIINQYWGKTIQTLAAFWPHLLSAAVTLIIGVLIIRVFRLIMMRLITRNRLDTTMLKFIMDVVIWTLRALLFVSVITKLGVETSAFVAAIGAAGLAIGLSLQGSLANFAGGLLIILFKPLRVGDYIEAQGEAGTVSAIFIFSTKIITPNNQSIYMPNGALSNGIIRNFSKELTRRTDITLSINHNSDVQQVKAIIFEILRADKRIQKIPEPLILVKDLTAEAILLSVLAWTSNTDFGFVISDFYQSIKKAFIEKGIEIPASKYQVIIENPSVEPNSNENANQQSN